MTTISLAPPLRLTRAEKTQADITEPTGFGRSVRVRTLMGWRPVSRLMAGDLILDVAGHLHELRAIRQNRVDGASVVRVARNGHAPLLVGAGQTMLSDDWRAQVIFGQPMASTAARMVDGRHYRRGQPQGTVLFQLEFDAKVSLDIDGAETVVMPRR